MGAVTAMEFVLSSLDDDAVEGSFEVVRHIIMNGRI